MIARVLLLAALAALLAGCGSSQHAVAPTVAHPKPPKPKPKPTHRAARHHTQLIVTILDGDRRVRVRGARVKLWGRHGRTDRHG